MITTIDDLVAFLKRFHRLPGSVPPAAPISADLPDALATIHREFGGLIEGQPFGGPFSTQDRLCPVGDLTPVDGRIGFAGENQGVWTAWCPTGAGDPFVTIHVDADRRPTDVPVSHFLITLCLQEAVLSCPNHGCIESDDGDTPADLLTVSFVPVWLDERTAQDETDETHDFWATPAGDVLVMRWGDNGIWVGSPSRPVGPLVRPGVDVNVLEGA